MKTVLFVPGFGMQANDTPQLFELMKTRGYDPHCVEVDWTKTVDDWMARLRAECVNYDPHNTVLAGFSLGAYTAFAVTAEWNPAELWAMSLSARFKEDLSNAPTEHLAHFTKEQLEAFESLAFGLLADKIQCPTLLFVGEEECSRLPSLAARVYAVHHHHGISSTLIQIPGVGHDITHEGYLAAIQDAI